MTLLKTARATVLATALLLAMTLAGCSATSGPSDYSGAQVGEGTSSDQPASDQPQGESSGESGGGGQGAEPFGDFCAAVEALNQLPDSDTMTDAERTQAIAVIDRLLAVWPADSRGAADVYFGELREVIARGEAVELDNTSEEFQAAFGTVFVVAADACPGGFG